MRKPLVSKTSFYWGGQLNSIELPIREIVNAYLRSNRAIE